MDERCSFSAFAVGVYGELSQTPYCNQRIHSRYLGPSRVVCAIDQSEFTGSLLDWQCWQLSFASASTEKHLLGSLASEGSGFRGRSNTVGIAPYFSLFRFANPTSQLWLSPARKNQPLSAFHTKHCNSMYRSSGRGFFSLPYSIAHANSGH